MIDGVLEFFKGKIICQWNAKILTLVLKKSSASRITHFRPVSCCNSYIKLPQKVLANRLKSAILTVISYGQSAFISRRTLVEIFLLVT